MVTVYGKRVLWLQILIITLSRAHPLPGGAIFLEVLSPGDLCVNPKFSSVPSFFFGDPEHRPFFIRGMIYSLQCETLNTIDPQSQGSVNFYRNSWVWVPNIFMTWGLIELLTCQAIPRLTQLHHLVIGY